MQYSISHHSIISDFDIELFAAGKHTRLYQKLGSYCIQVNEEKGVYFAVYAPSAKRIEVIGDFNGWDGNNHCLSVRWDGSGIWEGFISGLEKGSIYKYRIYSSHDDKIRDKADPYARLSEMPPKTASIVWDDQYEWQDDDWMSRRSAKNNLNAPISVYEVHIGSWKKNGQGQSLSYVELGNELVEYVSNMGYTHVELMPIMEHPYYLSWGYQCTGYFAPTSRFGNPSELKFLIDRFHQAGIGVYLDWVPAHFPSDAHALADFDGSALYEHPDRSKGFHPDWNSLIFNFERGQVCSFLMSSAHFWCDQFHADGIRVDAVASMIYLDYSREEGEWTPNVYGGNEYLAATSFLKELNTSIYHDFPDIQMMAEESTAFTGVTKPVDFGGLGFGLKWMMGWMNDTLEYMVKEPVYRSHHQHDITRSLLYAFTENFILPFSHDEVVHGKKSLISKMPGDDWQKFANLRLLYTYMYSHPGQKLNFMGGEIAQWEEWNVDESLSWHLLDFAPHLGIQQLIKTLNTLYKQEKSLFEFNYSDQGFEWIDMSDYANSVISYIRKGSHESLIIILNFTPTPHMAYEIGVPQHGTYKEIFNSNSGIYGGTGLLNLGTIPSRNHKLHGKPYSININLGPLTGIIIKSVE